MRRRDWLGAGAMAGIAGITAAGLFARVMPGSLAPGGQAPRGRTPAAGPVADDGALVVEERYLPPRTLDLTVRSPVLAGLGRARLLLPPGWSASAGRRWPVLWLLHGPGPGAGYSAWTTNGNVEQLTEHADVIVVMPDCGPSAIYTDWWNGGGSGPPQWETFHLIELRQILERGYRAGSVRAIAGNSTGGVGALAYAARHRGLFRAAAAFSAPLDTLDADDTRLDAADLIELATETGSPDLDWRRIWGDPAAQRVVWRQHNPYDLADRLLGVRLYLSAGEGDPIEELARRLTERFAAKLRRLGIPASLHLSQSSHSWPSWERELHAALPVLLAEIL